MIDKFKKLINHSFDDIKADAELITDLFKLYKAAFGLDPCSTCQKDHENYYKRLIEAENIFLQMEKGKYLLKKNTLLTIRGKHINVSNFNLTDKLAIELLKENKSRIKYFERYPENWEEDIKPKKRKKSVNENKDTSTSKKANE
jgi:hypothetical protein